MRYFSEEILKKWLPSPEWMVAMEENQPEEVINVRRCRDCVYYDTEIPTIDVNGEFGFCQYRTDLTFQEDGTIHYYFTGEDGFCNEDDII